MRTALFSIGILFAAAAHAGTLEKCQAKGKNPDSIQNCIDTERSHSTNRLREMGPLVLDAIHKETNGTRHKALLRAYRSAQAHHVRERAIACKKEAAGNERNACEADMNYAHIEQLARFLNN